MENTFQCVRFVWNKMLEYSNSYLEMYNKLCVPNYGYIAANNQFLNDKSFIVDRHSINNTKIFLKKAFHNFFSKNTNGMSYDIRKEDCKPRGYPRFKSKKHSKCSFTSYKTEIVEINYEDHMIKLNVLGYIEFDKREKQIPSYWKLKHYTISKSNDKYYVSLNFQYEDNRIPENPELKVVAPVPDLTLGLDYKSDGLYMDSNGTCCGMPKYYRTNQKRLRMLQKKLSRQIRDSHNYDKTRKKISKLHEHIRSCRRDFLHKLSTSIAKTYNVICVEDLNLHGISRSLKLGKSTMDNGFRMFVNMLSYKLYRIPLKILVKVNRFYPSSKTCSHCGYILNTLKLSDRVFKCPKCKQKLDRDYNAAINIKNEGISIIQDRLKLLCPV